MDESALMGLLQAVEAALSLSDEERLPQRVYFILQRAIRDLILPPGQMVLEQDVAKALHMSRTPVREALVRLEADALVELIPRHGFFVMPLVADVLQEIYEIVEGLEGIAVTLAAERITPDGVAALDGLVEASDTALQADDLVAWAELDEQFHSAILRLSGNARLARLAEIYNVHLYRARLFTLRLRPRPVRSIDEHRALVAHIGAHEAQQALNLYLAHRHHSQEEILSIIRATAGLPPQRDKVTLLAGSAPIPPDPYARMGNAPLTLSQKAHLR